MKNLDSTDKSAAYFDVCAKIEGLCAELYHFYSDIHVENEEVSKLWKKTALEEENHQKQFELASRIRDDVVFDLTADIEWTNRIHSKLSGLLQHVRKSPPDIETALSKAIEMEETLAELHLDSSVRFQDDSIRKLFQALHEFDQDHVKTLRHGLAIMTLSQSEMVG